MIKKRKIIEYFLAFLCVYGFLIAYLFLQQRSFIYFPDTNTPNISAVHAEDNVTEVFVTTQDDVRLMGWFIEPKQNDKPVILFFHGNAGNISHRFYKVSAYIDAGYSVLLAGYRGYGGNPSKPTETRLYNDARAYIAWLGQAGYTPQDIVLYGESLGTGVAVQMASEKPFQAMILETPYARLSDPAKRTYFFIPFLDRLMKDKFASIDKIGDISAPKLFLIAKQDEVLGPETGLDLYNAAPAPKTLSVFENARHNNIYEFGADKDVLKFLSAL